MPVADLAQDVNTQAAKTGAPAAAPAPAHVIVVGCEKGGSGKSTTSMHLTVALLRLGYKVGTIDLDARQWTLTRYLSNRAATMQRDRMPLPMPRHFFLAPSDKVNRNEAQEEDRARFEAILGRLTAEVDYVVIDCAGTDSFLARVAHSYADTLVTPVNDSFVDLDVVAHVDGRTGEVQRPSVYAEMVWEQRKARAKRDGGSIDWIVMRNRLSNLDANNKREMGEVLEKLARRIGFRLAPGFSERVIFRELFLQGLTMLDVFDQSHRDGGAKPRMSHVAARQEVRALINSLQLPERAPRRS
ncbi:ATPase [Thalassobaculum fulvum]|jgi:chromosome partitioning protein|uniref:ATPase n=1 Tax=Thalassobaculum fulvum TaxID=1633335 RepID=A0A919CPI3_9PROT|nr:ATPase [Thalassobaculum fulvum]